MTILQKLRLLVRLYKMYKTLDTPHIPGYQFDAPPGEHDLRDLAVGRWIHFKMKYSLPFTIGLTEDQEHTLLDMASHTIDTMKVKLQSTSILPFTGKELIARETLMEEWCREMIAKNQTAEEWIQSHDTP